MEEPASWSVSGAEGLQRPTPEPAAPPQPGERLGPYEVLGELGRGGMGVVLQAREVSSGREVALKLVLHELDDDARARFQREGLVTATLRHPGIVRVHTAGDVDGKPYLAYELIEGARAVDHDWPQRALPERVANVVAAAQALGHAHAHGIVHRDVKPQNILVDPVGHVRVTDFGLAFAPSQDRLTQTGALIGTPITMAPEQMQGEPVGPTADVFALGVVLYRALTGAPPFPATTLIELHTQLLQARPTPPRELDPTIPPGVEAVCLRALARDPRDRPADGAAFAAELEEALAGRRVPERRTLKWTVAACALLLLLAAAAAPRLLRGEGARTEDLADEVQAAAWELLRSRTSLAARRAELTALQERWVQLDDPGEAGPVLAAVAGLTDLAEGRAPSARRAAHDLPAGALRTLLESALQTEHDLAPPDALRVHQQLTQAVPDARFAELHGWRARALAGAAHPLEETEARRALAALPPEARARRPDRVARARLELRLGRLAPARKLVAELKDPPRDLVTDLLWRAIPHLSATEALRRLRSARVTPAEIERWPLAERRAVRERELASAKRRDRLAIGAQLPLLDGLRLARLLVDAPLPPEVLGQLVELYRLHADRDVPLALAISEVARDSFTVHRKLAERLEGLPNADTLSQVQPIFDRALRLAPTPTDRDHILLTQCVVLNELRRSDACIALTTDLLPRLTREEDRGKAFQMRAESHKRKGELQQALDDFDAALPLRPRRHIRLSFLRALVLERLGRPAEAFRAAYLFATTAPRSSKLTDAVRLVWTCARTADPAAVSKAVEHLLSVHPELPGWRVRAAWLRLTLGLPGVHEALAAAATELKESRHPHVAALSTTTQRLAERARTEPKASLEPDLKSLVRALETIRGGNDVP